MSIRGITLIIYKLRPIFDPKFIKHRYQPKCILKNSLHILNCGLKIHFFLYILHVPSKQNNHEISSLHLDSYPCFINPESNKRMQIVND